MMMKKFITLCVAAAFAVASAGVHAIMLVDSRSADPEEGDTSAIYAKETLLDTMVQEPPGDTTYYDIERRHYVSGPTTIYRGTTTANDAYVVSYTLDGMVFSEVPRAHAIEIDDQGMIEDITGEDDRALTISLGGGPGDSYVVFTANMLAIVRDPGDPDGTPDEGSQESYSRAGCEILHLGRRNWVHYEGGPKSRFERYRHTPVD